MQRIREFFVMPTASGVRWAAVGVAALIAVQTAAIATLILADRDGTYQPASGRQAGSAGVSALVAFTDEATAPAISKLLAEFGANIVDGPKSGGLYTIRLRIEDRSQAEAQLRRLEERRDIVRVVLRSRD
jgi:flagellar basal body-associated protein FliL